MQQPGFTQPRGCQAGPASVQALLQEASQEPKFCVCVNHVKGVVPPEGEWV